MDSREQVGIQYRDIQILRVLWILGSWIRLGDLCGLLSSVGDPALWGLLTLLRNRIVSFDFPLENEPKAESYYIRGAICQEVIHRSLNAGPRNRHLMLRDWRQSPEMNRINHRG